MDKQTEWLTIEYNGQYWYGSAEALRQIIPLERAVVVPEPVRNAGNNLILK